MARFSGLNVVRPLGNRNYALYCVGSTAALNGFWMQRIAVAWLTWELTHSGFWLGAVAAAELFPSVAIGPFAGAAIDRWESLRAMRVCVAARVVVSALLFAVTVEGLVSIWILLAINGTLGLIASFNQPARLALIPSLVKRDQVTAALALDSIIFNLALFVGPAIAGALIARGGTAVPFALSAGTFVVQFFCLLGVRVLTPEVRPLRKEQSLLRDTVDGLRYAATHPALAPLFFLHAVMFVLGRAFFELLPGFADQVFGAGAHGLAVLTSSVGVGAALGGLWIAARGVRPGLTWIVMVSAALIAVGLLGLTLSPQLWTAAAAVGLVGAAITIGSISVLTLVQMNVDPQMRGRAVSLYGIIFRGGPAVGAVLMGAASEYVGLRWPIAVAAVAILVAVAATVRRRGKFLPGLEAGLKGSSPASE